MENRNKLIPLLITVVFLTALGAYLYKNRETFVFLLNLSPPYLVFLAVTQILYILVIAILNKIILQRLEPKISTSEIIYLQFVNNFLNKIILKGGPAFRAVYLKQRYSLSYSKFLASFAGLIVIDLAAQALIGLWGMYRVYLRTGLYNLVVILGFVAIILGSLFIMVIRPKIPGHRNKFLREIKNVVEGWQIVVRNPKDVLLLVLISVIAVNIQALNTFLVFDGIDSPIGFSESLILSSLAGHTAYLNITPDGLGVREGIYLYVNSIISIPEPIMVLGSLVQRAITFIASALAGGLSYWILIRKPSISNEKEFPL